jgi:hypothetical protein
VLTGKNVPRAPHVGGELVDFFHSVHHLLDKMRIAEIAQQELIRGRFGELMPFQIRPADPKSLGLQPFHQMAADKAAGAGHQYSFHSVELTLSGKYHYIT